jgi:phage terminase large subunit
MPHLKRGAMRDFLKIMKDTNRYIDDHWNKSSSTYVFGNGSYIEFFSADSPDKLRGARRDILYINECNRIPYSAYQQLSIRTEGDIYLDYNPDRTFWAITEVMNEPDAMRIILNYKDNEAIPKNVLDDFEINKRKALTSDYWANWCKVYIDGELGSLEGAIFNNWKEIDRIPESARLIGCGLDFGFTNDPTAVVEVWKLDNQYIINEIIYETDLTNSDLSNLLKQMGIVKSTEIWCDSAEPKSIKDLTRMGWRALATKKGPDSITWGINVILENELLITTGSKNLLEEIQNYTWLKDKNDRKMNIPIDSWNHAIDAMRYLFMSKIGVRPENRKPFKVIR